MWHYQNLPQFLAVTQIQIWTGSGSQVMKAILTPRCLVKNMDLSALNKYSM
jgi:hypothetical protein